MDFAVWKIKLKYEMALELYPLALTLTVNPKPDLWKFGILHRRGPTSSELTKQHFCLVLRSFKFAGDSVGKPVSVGNLETQRVKGLIQIV